MVRNKIQEKMFLIPSLITVIGSFCGFLAILQAVKGNFDYSIRCIALSFVVDGLDGRVARRLNATSAFGREFDSLSDLVAFGVAPAILIYSWAFSQIADEFGVLVVFAYMVAGATRLARFNIDTRSRNYFVGLPIPAGAAALASLVYWNPQPVTSYYGVMLLLIYCVIIAVLMVSTLTYPSVKKIKLIDAGSMRNLVILAILVALTWYHSRLIIVGISTGYALSGLFIYAAKKLSPNIANKLKLIFEPNEH
ncbi:MAG: CDP-diacylglycerol--serine O-phosphatidyltransferase [Deltaproteobacteria bacterium]|nr:CDP-diacylglycerol--serine O-phosphatidyltransferase [Deltaproteobacteria bacterium]